MELDDAKRKLARAKAALDTKGHRPRHKTGFCGLRGFQVDSIEWWNDRVEELVAELRDEQERAEASAQVPAAIALFTEKA